MCTQTLPKKCAHFASLILFLLVIDIPDTKSNLHRNRVEWISENKLRGSQFDTLLLRNLEIRRFPPVAPNSVTVLLFSKQIKKPDLT